MKFADILNFGERELAAIVGAGGKTTIMFRLSEELKADGKSVLATTTTAIYYPDMGQYDNLFLLNGEEASGLPKLTGEKSITIVGNSIFNGNKLKGIDKKIADDMYRSRVSDYVLVEADGAKSKPIKAPEYYEPVIPDETTLTIGVIGMDSFGKEINDENVHRPEIFSRITGKPLNQKIDEHAIAKLVTSSQGLFKNSPPNSRKYLILNKVEDEYRLHFAGITAELIMKSGFTAEKIIIGSLRTGEIHDRYKG